MAVYICILATDMASRILKSGTKLLVQLNFQIAIHSHIMLDVTLNRFKFSCVVLVSTLLSLTCSSKVVNDTLNLNLVDIRLQCTPCGRSQDEVIWLGRS